MESCALALESSFLRYWRKFAAALLRWLIFFGVKSHSMIWSANSTFLINTLIRIAINEQRWVVFLSRRGYGCFSPFEFWKGSRRFDHHRVWKIVRFLLNQIWCNAVVIVILPKLAKSVSGHEICRLVICLQKMLVYRRQILDRQILVSLEEQIVNGVDVANQFVIFFIDHAIWSIVAVIES